jgi:hypothetical protein
VASGWPGTPLWYTLPVSLLLRLSFTDWSEEPAVGERIIGFCGKNDWSHSLCGVMEFGITTAPKNIELPMKVYELPELQNTDGGLGEVSPLVRRS